MLAHVIPRWDWKTILEFFIIFFFLFSLPHTNRMLTSLQARTQNFLQYRLLRRTTYAYITANTSNAPQTERRLGFVGNNPHNFQVTYAVLYSSDNNYPPTRFLNIPAHYCSIFTSILVIINHITHQFPEPAEKAIL